MVTESQQIVDGQFVDGGVPSTQPAADSDRSTTDAALPSSTDYAGEKAGGGDVHQELLRHLRRRDRFLGHP